MKTIRMPDGMETEDVELGLQAWEDLATPFAKLAGMYIRSYDPGVSFQRDSCILQFPVEILQTINEKLLKLKM